VIFTLELFSLCVCVCVICFFCVAAGVLVFFCFAGAAAAREAQRIASGGG